MEYHQIKSMILQRVKIKVCIIELQIRTRWISIWNCPTWCMPKKNIHTKPMDGRSKSYKGNFIQGALQSLYICHTTATCGMCQNNRLRFRTLPKKRYQLMGYGYPNISILLCSLCPFQNDESKLGKMFWGYPSVSEDEVDNSWDTSKHLTMMQLGPQYPVVDLFPSLVSLHLQILP